MDPVTRTGISNTTKVRYEMISYNLYTLSKIKKYHYFIDLPGSNSTILGYFPVLSEVLGSLLTHCIPRMNL